MAIKQKFISSKLYNITYCIYNYSLLANYLINSDSYSSGIYNTFSNSYFYVFINGSD